MSIVEKPKGESFDNGLKGPDGQYERYAVLPAAERAKGYVRPFRDRYRHVGINPQHPLRDLTESEKRAHVSCDYVKYEQYPEGSSIVGRFWTQKQLDSGCNSVTTMGFALSETYARDPSYYGSTFCCTCGNHFPVEEFVWEGTKDRVGS